MVIEEKLGVPRQATVWKEHLYELQGFRESFGPDLVGRIKRREVIEEGATVEMPERITLLARREDEVVAFKGLEIKIVGVGDGMVGLDLVPEDESVLFRLILDFGNEKLVFDPNRGLSIRQDRDSLMLVEQEIELLRFRRCILGNGHIEVWDEGSEGLLGRSEPYLPVNVTIDHDFFEQEIERLSAIAEKLRAN